MAARRKRILLWTKRFHELDWHEGFGNKAFKRCQFQNCEITNDKSLLLQSDAVMFHAMNLNWSSEFELTSLPSRRTSEQRWVYMTREPPYHTPQVVDTMRNIFNWTMTHR